MLRNFDETLATKSNKISVTELYDHIAQKCTKTDELVKF